MLVKPKDIKMKDVCQNVLEKESFLEKVYEKQRKEYFYQVFKLITSQLSYDFKGQKLPIFDSMKNMQDYYDSDKDLNARIIKKGEDMIRNVELDEPVEELRLSALL